MKLKEIFDQSDMIIEPWPDFEANCFRMGGPCRSTFNYSKLKLIKTQYVYLHQTTYLKTISDIIL